MPHANPIDTAKNVLLIMTAAGGVATGAYNYLIKPVTDNHRLEALEGKLAKMEPAVDQATITNAVVASRLDKLEQGQDKILDVVLDIKKKL